VVILVFVTQIQTWFISCCICNCLTRQFCTDICFIPSLLNVRWIWNSKLFLYACISDRSNKMCACFELAMTWMEDFSIFTNKILLLLLLLYVTKPRIHNLRVVTHITCDLNSNDFFLLFLSLAWWWLFIKYVADYKTLIFSPTLVCVFTH
jgi:hypothetical protein